MSTDLATRSPLEDAIEAALVEGNLAKLSTPQRIKYYHRTCGKKKPSPM